jgi:hypothetical protein
LGIASKLNDSVFNKMADSDWQLENISDTSYIIYAPQVSADGQELYFTRLLKGTVNTEICVSVRTATTDQFSEPVVIWSHYGYVPEAATVTTDKQRIYYHQKDGSGIFRIYLRYRTGTSAIFQACQDLSLRIFPNPATGKIWVSSEGLSGLFSYRIVSTAGEIVASGKTREFIELKGVSPGSYVLLIESDGTTRSGTLVIH